MRRGERLALEWQDIDFERRELLVRRRKNGKSRTLPLTARAHTILANMNSDWSKRVFPLSANAVRLAFERVRRRASLKDVRFHDLRHEAVSRLFERGLATLEVALLSGNKTVSQLFRYAHADIGRVSRFYQLHPQPLSRSLHTLLRSHYPYTIPITGILFFHYFASFDICF